ncbi:MAG: sigma-54-dependent Fis family transcriptional regulator [Deltaproteobacteria bacterium]|nr:sigma-54-dependent Fis family transcriptional regulator [Deltaproteobacteria bacterium]
MTEPCAQVLVVDDSPDALEIARRHLTAAGYTVLTASGAPEARLTLERVPVDLVITDMRMPEVGGLELVRHVRENCRATEVIVVTAYATVADAVEAVKTGAEEYLSKPYGERELLDAVERALERLRRRVAARAEPEPTAQPPEMIGASRHRQQVLRAITKAAKSAATVLITGESGVGKELVARAIHRQSARASGPWVPVNCGAIPQELFENELFGHAKGAFTGAGEAHPGFFQAADGGTLFLDEISELPLKLQVKLLRVLQDREVTMIGATRSRKVDVRIVAATGKELRAMVDEGTFRQDLYFRLSVLNIAVPPLRERPEDVALLARHFALRFASESGHPVPVLSDKLIEAFERYDWPGNIRELENLVQRLVVMADGAPIEITDLPEHLRFSVARPSPKSCQLHQAEREHIQRVLDSVGGNKTQAAKILGIDRKTLREKLRG